jgi:hypothetical protein
VSASDWRLVAVVVASVEVPVTERVDAVSEDADVVARYVIPLTVKLVEDALPSVDVPEMSVENVPVVNVGLGVIPMVDVPEKVTFDPALK